MTNHKEKSQSQLKTCHDQTDTFVYQKELEEGSANQRVSVLSDSVGHMLSLNHSAIGQSTICRRTGMAVFQ